MKRTNKILTAAFAFCIFMSAQVFGASLYKGNAPKKSFTMVDNQYGDNFQTTPADDVIFPKDYLAKAGDKITVHIEATVDKEIVFGKGGDEEFSLQFLVVDASPKANYWTVLSKDNIDKPVKPGEKFVYDYAFVLEKDALVKSGENGCRFVMQTSDDQKVQVVFKTTAFTYNIER